VGNELVVWSLTNTKSLDAKPPAPPVLQRHSLPVKPYSTPPFSEQKPGHIPLADCLNDPVCRPTLGADPHPFGPETLGPLDSNDVRMQQVWLAGGRLWAALGTETIVNGTPQAGIEYFVVRPNPDPALSRVEANDYISLAGTNITFPATAATDAGRAVIALTVVGPSTYPSAGYVRLDSNGRAGPVHIAAAGVGPQDGFTEYNAWHDRTFPRWGDYGAAAVDGNTIWIGSEYIGQTCRYTVWLRDRTCHKTRVERGNWYTRISAVTP
jgi:hypothetical protein